LFEKSEYVSEFLYILCLCESDLCILGQDKCILILLKNTGSS